MERTAASSSLLAGLLGVAAGAAGAWWMLGTPTEERARTDSALTPDSERDGELAAALRELSEVLRDLQLAPEGPVHSVPQVAPVESTRVSVDQPAPTLDADRLTQALERLERRLATSPAGAGPVSPQPPIDHLALPHDPRAAIHESLTASIQRAEALHGADPDSHFVQQELARTHLLWSMDRVLETYGVPYSTWIGDYGTVTWWYEIPFGEDESRGFQLSIENGVVVAVEY